MLLSLLQTRPPERQNYEQGSGVSVRSASNARGCCAAASHANSRNKIHIHKVTEPVLPTRQDSSPARLCPVRGYRSPRVVGPRVRADACGCPVDSRVRSNAWSRIAKGRSRHCTVMTDGEARMPNRCCPHPARFKSREALPGAWLPKSKGRRAKGASDTFLSFPCEPRGRCDPRSRADPG